MPLKYGYSAKPVFKANMWRNYLKVIALKMKWIVKHFEIITEKVDLHENI